MICTYCKASTEENGAPIEACEDDSKPHCLDCHLERHDRTVTIHLEVVVQVPQGTKLGRAADGQGRSIVLPSGKAFVPLLALEDEADPSAEVIVGDEAYRALGMRVEAYSDSTIEGNDNVPLEE